MSVFSGICGKKLGGGFLQAKGKRFAIDTVSVRRHTPGNCLPGLPPQSGVSPLKNPSRRLAQYDLSHSRRR